MLSHGLKYHPYANDFTLFYLQCPCSPELRTHDSIWILNHFHWVSTRQCILQKSRARLWLSTPAISSSTSSISVNSNSSLPGAQLKHQEPHWTPFPSYSIFPSPSIFCWLYISSSYTQNSGTSHHVIYDCHSNLSCLSLFFWISVITS